MSFFKNLVYIIVFISTIGILQIINGINLVYEIKFNENIKDKHNIFLFKKYSILRCKNIITLIFLFFILLGGFLNKISFTKTLSLTVMLYICYYLVTLILKNKYIKIKNEKDLNIELAFSMLKIVDNKILGNIDLSVKKDNVSFIRVQENIDILDFLISLKESNNNISFFKFKNAEIKTIEIFNVEISYEEPNTNKTGQIDFKDVFISNLKTMNLDVNSNENITNAIDTLKRIYVLYGSEEDFNSLIKNYI